MRSAGASRHGARVNFSQSKVMGNLAGIWLLRPRVAYAGGLGFGMWLDRDKVRERVGPRLAIAVTDSRGGGMCRTGLRHRRTLNQLGSTSWPDGLPFLAQRHGHPRTPRGSYSRRQYAFPIGLGKVRRARPLPGPPAGHPAGGDPHRVRSFSKRHMRLHRHDDRGTATKTAQDFVRD